MSDNSELIVYYENLISELLREIRHDYLNDLQLIYGYIRLNKPDNAIKTINSISERSRIDSKLSKLNCLNFYILLMKIYKNSIYLDLNINFEVQIYSDKEDIVHKNCIDALNQIDECMKLILQFLYKNDDFEEHIFYIEEHNNFMILKIDLEYIVNSNLLIKDLNTRYEDYFIDENYLIYKLELNKG